MVSSRSPSLDRVLGERRLLLVGGDDPPPLVGDDALPPVAVDDRQLGGLEVEVAAGRFEHDAPTLRSRARRTARPASVAPAADGGHHFLGDLVRHEERPAGAEQTEVVVGQHLDAEIDLGPDRVEVGSNASSVMLKLGDAHRHDPLGPPDQQRQSALPGGITSITPTRISTSLAMTSADFGVEQHLQRGQRRVDAELRR